MTNKDLTEIIKRIEKLENAVFFNKKNKKTIKILDSNVNFSVNERAFVTKYAVGKSGPKKFTLLLAYFTKGDVNKNFEVSEIKKHWSKMEAKNMLGKFNGYYSNEAKNQGWVDSKETGEYNLTNEWKDIL